MLPDALLGQNDPHKERQEERHGQRGGETQSCWTESKEGLTAS